MPEKDYRRFWGRYARFYDWEVLRFSKAAYQRMYGLMSEVLTPDMDVLELACGTGLISHNIAGFVHSLQATDYSEGMIAAARKKAAPANLSFSIKDATAVSFPDSCFDAVVISNALHVMPRPELALAEVKRLLVPDGLLIAPSFTHGHISESAWKLNNAILRLIGFQAYNKWTVEDYLSFIRSQGFEVGRWLVLDAAFPLVYVEARLL